MNLTLKQFPLNRIRLGALFITVVLSGCTFEAKTNINNLHLTEQPFKEIKVDVTNANTFKLESEPIYFSFKDLSISAVETKNIAMTEKGIAQPSQLIDLDGDGKNDGVLLNTDFSSSEKRHFILSTDPSIKNPSTKKRTQAEISVKEGGEWKGTEYLGGSFKNVDRVTPPPQCTDHSFYIRYEGPGIESDKVAYRVYLDWRNGFDIFGKVTHDVVLQKIGLDGYESYHNLLDWGQDIFKVGESLGVGGFGFWNGQKVDLVSKVNTREAIITNNGDLYSSFKIKYNGWQVNNQTTNLTADLSMNAGSRLVKVRLQSSDELPNVAIGLVKHPNTKLIESKPKNKSSDWTYVGSWGKQSLSGDNLSGDRDYLGIAIIFRRDDRLQQAQDDTSYVSVMSAKSRELDYYFVAAWDQELNGIKTEAEFIHYLDRETKRLSNPTQVKILK